MRAGRATARYALLLLYGGLALAPLRAGLEATMAAHMLVQIPLLGALGFLAARWLPPQWQQRMLALSGGPAAWVVVAVFAMAYWMLPRVLDAALVSPAVELAKFLTVPLLVGLPLGLAWPQLSLIGRGFVWTNMISMLAVLGWLYLAAPLRACNSYSLEQQQQTGGLLVGAALILFVVWFGTLFIGRGAATGR